MKKILAILLVSVVCFGLFACSENKSEETTCNTDPTDVSTEGTTAPPPSWEKAYYVDEFGDETSEYYLRGSFTGTFSNSATTGSELEVYFFCDPKLDSASYDAFSVRLIEYGSTVANIKDSDSVTIKIKIDGQVYEGEPWLINDRDIYINRGEDVFRYILDGLNEGKEISFVINVDSPYGGVGSKYNFVINANGLSDIPHSWKGTM